MSIYFLKINIYLKKLKLIIYFEIDTIIETELISVKNPTGVDLPSLLER